MTTRESEPLREERKVERAGINARRNDARPDPQPLWDPGQRKVDDEPQSSQERIVEILLPVGGKNCQSFESRHPLEEVADLEIGVAVVCVLDLGAFSEERVRL